MITRKKAIELTKRAEMSVYSETEDIAQLIQLHAELGMDEMEVFVEKKSVKKLQKVLSTKNFYSKATEFKSLENECRLYISWISNI